MTERPLCLLRRTGTAGRRAVRGKKPGQRSAVSQVEVAPDAFSKPSVAEHRLFEHVLVDIFRVGDHGELLVGDETEGADREDRLRRHVDGRVPLNGGLGEIYRNFFYMPDRPSSTGAVISTFYSRYDPAALTSRFDERRFRAGMAQAMREAIGADSDRLTRAQVESLYPKFRGRFWTGRDASNNQRFGPMFFPFLEHTAANNTAGIPIRYKDLGLLQGRMIELVHARLAAYPSDYGFPLSGPRPWRYRLKTRLGTWRPPALRKLSFRLKVRSPTPRIGALSDEFLGRVMDPTLPLMGQLFRLERVFSLDQFGRIVSLEYLGQHCGLELPPA